MRIPPLLYSFVVLGSFGLPSACRAQAFIEHVWPPSVQRGQTNRVTLVGAQMRQAIGLWSSTSPGVVRAALAGPSEEGKATFDVHVAAAAPLGLYGLRLATT